MICIFGSICICKGVFLDVSLVKLMILLKKSVVELKVLVVIGCFFLSFFVIDLLLNKIK